MNTVIISLITALFIICFLHNLYERKLERRITELERFLKEKDEKEL